MKVVLASHNQKKMVEMKAILSQMGVEVLSQAEVGMDLEPEETGTTFSNFVIQTRIEKSKQLLLNSGIALADVACMVGFVDQSYYTKCFRRLVGVSPGKYRHCQGKLDGGE